MYYKTLTSAQKEAAEGNIAEWIRFFLTTGYNKNQALADGLAKEPRRYKGPVKIILSDYERVCGPEDNMLYQVDEVYFNHKVKKMMKQIQEGWDVPPLIIEVNNDSYLLSDGNHRFEAFSRLGIKEYYAIFWSKE